MVEFPRARTAVLLKPVEMTVSLARVSPTLAGAQEEAPGFFSSTVPEISRICATGSAARKGAKGEAIPHREIIAIYKNRFIIISSAGCFQQAAIKTE
jgi:hypothetical protein